MVNVSLTEKEIERILESMEVFGGDNEDGRLMGELNKIAYKLQKAAGKQLNKLW